MLKPIDRKVTLLLLDTSIKQFGENWLQDKLTKNGLLIAKQIVLKQPTIEAEPVRHGHWIWVEPYGALHTHLRKCSECGEIKAQEATKFCSNCGARMEDT